MPPITSHNQPYQQQSNANVAMGPMIPTPGAPQSGYSNLMAPSAANRGNSMMSSVVNQGTLSMNALRPSRSTHTDGEISSTGGQRMGSQMMPTPGFNNSTSNQSYVKLEPLNNVSVISSVDSMMVSQPLQQKQQTGGQNSQILHSLGSHMGGGIRSTSTQKSYGFPNGSLNGNLGMVGKSSQMVDSFGNSEGFLADSYYGNSQASIHVLPREQASGGDETFGRSIRPAIRVFAYTGV